MALKKKGKAYFSGQGTKKVPHKAPEEVIALVNTLAGPLCENEGMELVHVEYQREAAGWVLRLYIDQPGGVRLEDCSRLSRQLGDLLDVTVENIGPYNLEVSSPGINRPLGKTSDYERFKGNMARIRTSMPIDRQKKFEGILSGLKDGVVTLLIDDKTVAIPFQTITRARLVNYNGEN